MIKFSIFLQENERKKKRADEKINTEKRVRILEGEVMEMYR
jgi:hypothetical protein